MEENQKNKRKKTTGQKKNRVKAKKCQRHLSKQLRKKMYIYI